MKSFCNNIGYFLKEVKTIIKLNPLSNVFSLLSTGLIFFILALVISGWWVSNEIVEAIQEEAEISVYYKETFTDADTLQLLEEINAIGGVKETRLVDKNEAYNRMADILGKDADVLKYFDDNPFSPFVEVKINMEQMENVLDKLGLVAGIEHVRDNKDVLDRLQHIAKTLTLLGYLVITAVGISTLVIIAHIIRMGIYDNKEQIYTLRLLGAPESFIAFPFLLSGLVITLGGGILASIMSVFTIKYVYAQMAGPLPFIPLPPLEALIPGLLIFILAVSSILGIAGGVFGLSSAKRN